MYVLICKLKLCKIFFTPLLKILALVLLTLTLNFHLLQYLLNYSKQIIRRAVLTCTHNLCVEKNMKIVKKNQQEIVIFYSRENSLNVAWACFRNDKKTGRVEILCI